MPTENSTYRFRFFRAGAVDQVVLDKGALENLATLNKKLWMALACPTRNVDIDPRTLDIIDTDKDGRIRPPELLAAVDWSIKVFAELDDLWKPLKDDELPLSALSKDTEEGRAVESRARRILKNLGREDATAIKLSDVLDTENIFVQTKLNGDGVVPVSAAEDDATRALLTDIMTVSGSVKDRSGEAGIDQAKADAFFTDLAVYKAWLDVADASVRVLGEATDAAAVATADVRAKVDDHFVRARLAAYKGELAPALGASVEEAQALGHRDLALDDAELATWPVSAVAAGAPLVLDRGLNPAWAKKMQAFATLAVTPIRGNASSPLTESEWIAIKDKLAPFFAWQSAKPALTVNALSPARATELSAADIREKVNALIAADAALASENDGIESVEKAIRLRRDLILLLRNFLNFSDFYGKRLAIFQAGTLYIDGRSCELCLPVQDVGKHAALAGLAKAYLLYCDCTRKGQDKRVIVAAVTGGGIDNLLVGRNGVFYDRKGDDWDATVTKIVENPISVRQAFFAPYKRFVRAIEEQVAKRAAAADDKSNKALDTHATQVASADVHGAAAAEAAAAPAAAAAAPKPVSKGIDIGTVAAIGVAVGGIATFFSSILATFFGLGMWMPAGIIGLLLAISGPSMLIAWLKLRQRNIGPILDANGWAVNAFARINVPFGGALTKTAELPKGAVRLLDDPFAEKRPPYKRYATLALLVVLIFVWILGKLDGFLPAKVRASTVFHPTTEAPVAAPPPAAPAKPAASTK